MIDELNVCLYIDSILKLNVFKQQVTEKSETYTHPNTQRWTEHPAIVRF